MAAAPFALCVVSYLNSKPFVEGLQHEFQPSELAIQEWIPSQCVQAFATGQCQVGLIPVAGLLQVPNATLLPNYCIGANGQVDSVFLVAQQPIQTLTQLYLDPHSRTSNGLARILLRYHWQQTPAILRPTDDSYHAQINGSTGGIIIGDRAIAARSLYAYVYDLAAAWKTWTGLPFVFAVWAAHPEQLQPAVHQRILAAFEYGMAHREAIAAKWAQHFQMSTAAASAYLHHAIDYHFDDAKREALQLYLHHLAALEGTAAPVLR